MKGAVSTTFRKVGVRKAPTSSSPEALTNLKSAQSRLLASLYSLKQLNSSFKTFSTPLDRPLSGDRPAAGGTPYYRPSNTKEFRHFPQRVGGAVTSAVKMVLDPEQMRELDRDTNKDESRGPLTWVYLNLKNAAGAGKSLISDIRAWAILRTSAVVDRSSPSRTR